jgi:hypothetical protein
MNDDFRISPQELDAAVRYSLERIGGANAEADFIRSLAKSVMLSPVGVHVARMVFRVVDGADSDLAFTLYFSGIIHGRASLHADELRISPEELDAAAYRVKALKFAETNFGSMVHELMPSAAIRAAVAMAIEKDANPNMAIGAYITGLLHGRASMLLPEADT